MTIRPIAWSAALLLVLSSSARAQRARVDTAAAMRAAEAAATRWIELVDASKYDASWDSSAAFLREKVTRRQWNEVIGQARAQVDPLRGRRLVHAQYRDQLPQAPPNDYVLLEYATDAGDGTHVIETITMVRERNDQWRVIGYFIRPA